VKVEELDCVLRPETRFADLPSSKPAIIAGREGTPVAIDTGLA
jgi:hypothetical protein